MRPATARLPLWLAVAALALYAPAAPSGQELVFPALTQSPRDGRSAEPPPTGTASITGTVVVAGTGAPARKARVALSGDGFRSQSVATDEFGRFVFAALPAGRYSVSASKPGHVTILYGQRTPGPGRPGTPIQLADGQEIAIELLLPRGGVITGTVLDEHGEALPGTPVRALRFAVRGGERTLQAAGSGSTDDRGVYRIYGLQPGEYIVAATPRNARFNVREVEAVRAQVEALRAQAGTLAPVEASAALETAERMAAGFGAGGDADPDTGYAPVYYPGTTTPAAAAAIALGIGEEKMGIDFSLQLVPVAQIDGIIVTDGEPAQSIQVSLIDVGHNVPGMGSTTARPDREGRFTLRNVAPGHYILAGRGTLRTGGRGEARGEVMELEPAAGRGMAVRAALQARAQTERLWAMTPVVVDGRNLSNIVLTLQRGMTVSGRLVFEGTSTLPADLSRLRVSVSPTEPAGAARQIAASVSGRADAAGRFTLSGVPPGRYRLTASGAGGGWRMASAMVAGADALDFPFEVKPNEHVTGAVLTFTDRSTELSGTIVDARGQPAPDYTIVVFPDDRQFWGPNSRRIMSQRPATDGRFTFRNLPAGEYRIAPMLDPEPGSWYDPALLQQLELHALRVPLGEGESKVQNLRVDGR